MSLDRFITGKHFSKAVAWDGLVFVAGQIADDTSGSVADQARQVFAKIDAILAKAGTDKTRLLSVEVWLRDMSDREEMNKAWESWLTAPELPARIVLQAGLSTPDHRIAVKVVATR